MKEGPQQVAEKIAKQVLTNQALIADQSNRLLRKINYRISQWGCAVILIGGIVVSAYVLLRGKSGFEIKSIQTITLPVNEAKEKIHRPNQSQLEKLQSKLDSLPMELSPGLQDSIQWLKELYQSPINK